jgi:hypothetical protein
MVICHNFEGVKQFLISNAAVCWLLLGGGWGGAAGQQDRPQTLLACGCCMNTLQDKQHRLKHETIGSLSFWETTSRKLDLAATFLSWSFSFRHRRNMEGNTNQEWQEVVLGAGAWPAPRHDHTTVVCHSSGGPALCIYGGFGEDGRPLHDLCFYYYRSHHPTFSL